MAKGRLSNLFIIRVLAAKFQEHSPVYRQCAGLLEDQGIDLSRQTLNDAILTSSRLWANGPSPPSRNSPPPPE